jgi:molybdopterin converting factor small subunit
MIGRYFAKPIRDSGMRVTFRLFAILRDRAGTPEVVLDLPPGATAGDAAEALFGRIPALRAEARPAAFAVNRAYAGRDVVLSDGDELALIPPVSGG